MVGSKIGKQLRGIRNEKDTNLGGEGKQVADRSTWMIALDHLESVTGNFIQDQDQLWKDYKNKLGKYLLTRTPKTPFKLCLGSS